MKFNLNFTLDYPGYFDTSRFYCSVYGIFIRAVMVFWVRTAMHVALFLSMALLILQSLHLKSNNTESKDLCNQIL